VTGSASGRTLRPLGAAALVVGAGVAALGWWWLEVTPWSEPLVALFVFVPVPISVWLLLDGGRLDRRATAAVRVAVWVLLALVVVGTVALAVSGTVGRLRFGSALDAMGTLAEQSLEGLGVPVQACGVAPPLDYGPLGQPSEVCVVTYDIGVAATQVAFNGEPAMTGEPVQVRQVRFIWPDGGSGGGSGVAGDGAGQGHQLVFEAAVAQPPAGKCVRLVQGQWWAWTAEVAGCPRGFVPSST